MPAGDGHEWDVIRIVPDLLDVALHFFLDFIEASFAVWRFSVVHLVHTDDQLLDAEREGKQGVLASLTVLADTSLELAHTSSDDQHGTIGLKNVNFTIVIASLLAHDGWYAR